MQGDTVTCTITNDDTPATLTLVKQVVTDDGGTAAATDWNFDGGSVRRRASTGPTGDPGRDGRTGGRRAPTTLFGVRARSGYTSPTAWSCVGGGPGRVRR